MGSQGLALDVQRVSFPKTFVGPRHLFLNMNLGLISALNKVGQIFPSLTFKALHKPFIRAAQPILRLIVSSS